MNIKEQGKEEVFASWAEFGKSNAFRKLSAKMGPGFVVDRLKLCVSFKRRNQNYPAFQNAIFNNNFSIA